MQCRPIIHCTKTDEHTTHNDLFENYHGIRYNYEFWHSLCSWTAYNEIYKVMKSKFHSFAIHSQNNHIYFRSPLTYWPSVMLSEWAVICGEKSMSIERKNCQNISGRFVFFQNHFILTSVFSRNNIFYIFTFYFQRIRCSLDFNLRVHHVTGNSHSLLCTLCGIRMDNCQLEVLTITLLNIVDVKWSNYVHYTQKNC